MCTSLPCQKKKAKVTPRLELATLGSQVARATVAPPRCTHSSPLAQNTSTYSPLADIAFVRTPINYCTSFRFFDESDVALLSLLLDVVSMMSSRVGSRLLTDKWTPVLPRGAASLCEVVLDCLLIALIQLGIDIQVSVGYKVQTLRVF